MIKAVRLLALFGPTVAALMLSAVGSLHARPGDVTSSAAPIQGPTVAPKTQIPQGAYSVSSATGAAGYSVPIFVPPGRNGVQPALALSYSSQAPERGGVAMGWSLPIPVIEVDTSQGRIPEMHYRSSLAGGQRLIEVDEPGAGAGVRTFRARNDGTWARYEKLHSGGWRVRATTGGVMHFGVTTSARDNKSPGALEARWFVERVEDRFGNTIQYYYDTVIGGARNGVETGVVDIALAAVDYNKATPTGSGHARIEFEYFNELETCPGSHVPIGSQFDYSTGVRLYRGARRLTTIHSKVRESGTWRTVRTMSLSYDYAALGYDVAGISPGTIVDPSSLPLTCQNVYASQRVLEQINQRGISRDGTVTDAPPITFGYGPMEHELATPKQIEQIVDSTSGLDYGLGSGARRFNRDAAGGWPTIDSMLLDFDGDGRLDILSSKRDKTCSFTWRRNLGGAGFAEPVQVWMPKQPWANGVRTTSDPAPGEIDTRMGSPVELEGCTLASQFTERRDVAFGGANYLSYRFMDLDGTGKPQLVTSFNYKEKAYNPFEDPNFERLATAPPEQFACESAAGSPAPCVLRSSDLHSDPAADAPLPALAAAADGATTVVTFSECPENFCHDARCANAAVVLGVLAGEESVEVPTECCSEWCPDTARLRR